MAQGTAMPEWVSAGRLVGWRIGASVICKIAILPLAHNPHIDPRFPSLCPRTPVDTFAFIAIETSDRQRLRRYPCAGMLHWRAPCTPRAFLFLHTFSLRDIP
ncbi:hypothetical protein [Variovorax sp. PAMC26660]|uniref:hypothetical protein n=1 Tax=Variovorax sp. PAMC26660 TaxID=2762322 RepID=UPI00164E9DA0|nr:hypothetical protein [Variovorax sp. PAMC26660]QNK66965.1 hypothetical protein H7F35_27950 [Variovorax sp. PAMC26660]